MEYTVIFNGKSYDLPKYNLKISAKLEQTEQFRISDSSANEQLRKMYSLCSDLLGKENAVEIMGKVDEADPNMINIVYLSIIDSYNRPLAEFETERQTEQLNTEAYERLKEIFIGAKDVSALMEKK